MATIRLVRLAVLGAAIGAALTVGTGPAGAGECMAGPGHGDGRVREGSDPYIGQGIFDCEGSGQSAQRLLDPGDKATFAAKWLNDGSASTKFRLNANVAGDTSEFKVTFLVGGNDVTQKVVEPDGGKTLKHVAAGTSTKTLKIEIKVRSTSDPGDDANVIASGYRNGDDSHFPDRVGVEVGVPI